MHLKRHKKKPNMCLNNSNLALIQDASKKRRREKLQSLENNKNELKINKSRLMHSVQRERQRKQREIKE